MSISALGSAHAAEEVLEPVDLATSSARAPWRTSRAPRGPAPNSLISTGRRRAGEIVDDVGEDLHELDAQPRHRRLDLAAHVVDDLERRRDRARARGLSRTTMSPRFCSVAKSPSSAPVRRDVPATSGVGARIRSTMCTCRSVSASAVPPGVEVVEDERPLVHLRQEPGGHERAAASTPATTSTAATGTIQRAWRQQPRRARARSGRRASRCRGPMRASTPVADCRSARLRRRRRGQELFAQQRNDRERETSDTSTAIVSVIDSAWKNCPPRPAAARAAGRPRPS